MNSITKLFVRISESKGQTMAEYALIMAAVAVVAIVAYNTLGGDIVTLVNTVGSDL